jgi:hypothetical protein
VQDNGGVDTSAVGKALDFVEEVLRGKINIAMRTRCMGWDSRAKINVNKTEKGGGPEG